MIAQIPGVADPTIALTAASIFVIGCAVVGLLQRFYAMNIKAENDRLRANDERHETRYDELEKRHDELEAKCRDLGDRLWLTEQRLRTCAYSACPQRPSPTRSDPA